MIGLVGTEKKGFTTESLAERFMNQKFALALGTEILESDVFLFYTELKGPVMVNMPRRLKKDETFFKGFEHHRKTYGDVITHAIVRRGNRFFYGFAVKNENDRNNDKKIGRSIALERAMTMNLEITDELYLPQDQLRSIKPGSGAKRLFSRFLSRVETIMLAEALEY